MGESEFAVLGYVLVHYWRGRMRYNIRTVAPGHVRWYAIVVTGATCDMGGSTSVACKANEELSVEVVLATVGGGPAATFIDMAHGAVRDLCNEVVTDCTH